MFKKLFMVSVVVMIGLSTNLAAAVMTPEQQTAVVDSLSSAYGEYFTLLIAVITVSAAFYLISNFARRLGKGRV